MYDVSVERNYENGKRKRNLTQLILFSRSEFLQHSSFRKANLKADMFERFLRCSTDSIYEITGFLSAEECCKFSMSTKAIQRMIDSDKIWDFYSLTRIKGFADTEFDNNYEKIRTLKNLLGYKKSKDFYVSFRLLEFNILGWFRALPPFTLYDNGGLYCGRITSGEFLYQLVNAHGDIVGNEYSFKIRYDKGANSLVAKSYGSEGKTYVLKLGKEILFVETRTSTSRVVPIHAAMVLATLPNNANLSRALSAVSKPYVLESCFGLHTAPYGTHGLEILNVSLHDRSDDCWIKPMRGITSSFDFGELQLHGLKIKGDPNVPAGQISFCININSLVNPQQAVQRDQRIIVSFPPNSREPDFISLEERLDSIASWYRGYGQINRRPSVWNPEWVSCSLILYQNPLVSGARFTILWDNETEYYRHAMDFIPLPQGSAPSFSRPILM